MTSESDGPTFREMTLRVFEGKTNPHVLFQPRFEPWFDWQRQFDRLPAEIADLDIAGVFDHLGCSMRYVHYYTPCPNPIVQSFDPEVRIEREDRGETQLITYHTPHGPLHETRQMTVDGVWRTVDHAGKALEDLPRLKWLLARRRHRLNAEAFARGDAYIGERGMPQFWVPKSPYLTLCQQWMNFEPFIYALHDAPAEMAEIMAVIDENYDTLYAQLVAHEGVRLINYGENVAEAHSGPTLFERYLLPWYEKRVGQLRAAGVFTHIHIDGAFRTLIPLIRQLPHDGIEALTPRPQGDETMDEMQEAVGEKVLLDGIPAVLFMSQFPVERLERCVKNLVDRFGGRLVMGISDELPEGAGVEGYERLKRVAAWARGAVAA